MRHHFLSRNVFRAISLISILLVVLQPAFAHHVDVHGSATNNLTQKAVDICGISFQSTDVTRMKQGSVDEDNYVRFRGHHFNPHTGSGGPWSGEPAVATASSRWNLMRAAFTNSSTRWYGDESAGTQGSLHALGRVLHLLQDMAAPPHVHAPTGHGWAGIRHLYYSDFEEKWSPSSSVYAAWTFPSVTGGPMTPNDAITASIPNSKIDSESLSEMRSRLSAIPSSERNQIEGYMKAQAWVTYFHTSFYGQIDKDQANPAPSLSDSGRTNILRRMFPGRISFHDSILGDYWTVDGVGTCLASR